MDCPRPHRWLIEALPSGDPPEYHGRCKRRGCKATRAWPAAPDNSIFGETPAQTARRVASIKRAGIARSGKGKA